MANQSKSFFLFISFFLFGVFQTNMILAQGQVRFGAVNLDINGTSTLHDWEIKSTDGAGSAVLVFNKSGNLTNVNSIQFTTNAKSLKSESSIMDNNTYSALNAKKFPQISFVGNSTKVVSTDGVKHSITVSGKLTIAGTTLPVELYAVGILTGDKILTITCTKIIDMKAWGVKPPTFMMGAMKTGKDVVIKFQSTLQK
ncbi:MAG TPA: YceI family protein [Saprospiraceae bacterium]|nr:YceI family protein [Saprospiraceae bacterium]